MRDSSWLSRSRGLAAALLLAASGLAACASDGSAKPVAGRAAPPAVSSDPTAQAALERACYGCHASGYGLAGRERLAYSYWFRRSAQKALDFSRWSELSPGQRGKKLHAVERSVKGGHMPPWDARLFDGRAKLSRTEREALLQIAEHAAS